MISEKHMVISLCKHFFDKFADSNILTTAFARIHWGKRGRFEWNIIKQLCFKTVVLIYWRAVYH